MTTPFQSYWMSHSLEFESTEIECYKAFQAGMEYQSKHQCVGVVPPIVDSNGRTLLSSREHDVMELVVHGHSNKETAKALGLSAHTVRNYLFKIYNKLGISNRVELVRYASKINDNDKVMIAGNGG